MKKKSYWHLIKGSVLQWIEDEPFSLAAALSYYTLFSLAPLLVIAIAVAGFAFGRDAAQNQVVAALQGVIGQESAQAVQGVVENASKQPKTGIVSTVVGVVALLFGAGGVVGQLQTSLNKGACHHRLGVDARRRLFLLRENDRNFLVRGETPEPEFSRDDRLPPRPGEPKQSGREYRLAPHPQLGTDNIR